MNKILIYTENYVPGGGNRYLVDIVNSVPENISITILSNIGGVFDHDKKKIVNDYTYEQIKIYTLPNYIKRINNLQLLIQVPCKLFLRLFRIIIVYFFNYLNKKKFIEVIKTLNPDLIISCNGGYPGGLSCLDFIEVAYKTKIPSILSVVSTPQKKNEIDIVYSQIKHKYGTLIVNCNFIKDKFIFERKFSPDNIQVVHNCIDLSQIESNNPYTTEFNLKDNYTIGYVGRIEKLKGIYILIEAFRSISKKFPDVKLIIVGAGEIEKAKLIVEKAGISDQVIFTGFYNGNIYNAIISFNIFVFPSLWEGLPYSILEAMAMEKLIISSNVGGIPEQISDNYDGILIPPNNPDILSETLNKVLSSPKKYEYLSKNARKTIQKNFSFNQFKEKVTAIINDKISN